MTQAEWTEKVGRTYHDRGLGGRSVAGDRPAVVVVDLIDGFTDPLFPAGSNLDAVVGATRELLDAARAASAPVIFTSIAFTPDRLAHTPWLRMMPAMRGLLQGSRWVEVDARLGRRESEPLVIKRTASAFAGTDLASLLTSLGVDTVVVCGATTSGCVRATVVDACMSGWPAFVPRECAGDRAAEPHAASLFDIDAKYGDVVLLPDAIRLVSRVRDAS